MRQAAAGRLGSRDGCSSSGGGQPWQPGQPGQQRLAWPLAVWQPANEVLLDPPVCRAM